MYTWYVLEWDTNNGCGIFVSLTQKEITDMLRLLDVTETRFGTVKADTLARATENVIAHLVEYK